jgi:hypothetical protein
MIEVALLPFLMFSDVLLISSLEKYEYGNILIALTIIVALLIICWFVLENHEVLSIWLFSLYIIPYHFGNEIINRLMGHSENDTNKIRRIQKFVRTRLIFGMLIFYQVVFTIANSFYLQYSIIKWTK